MKLKSSGTIIAIIITAIVTAVVVAVVVYLWQQNKCLKTSSTSSTTEVAATTPTPVPQTTIDMTDTGSSPSDVTENFILYTLGTVPGAEINYVKAKNYVSQNVLNQWTDDSFVPQFYGIQEGPDAYEIKTQTINGDSASVKVDVVYGEMMQAWAFILAKENGAWKIDEFRSDGQ